MRCRTLTAATMMMLAVDPMVAPMVEAADLCLADKFQCNGFEPNWQLFTTVDVDGRSVVRFVDPENPNWQIEQFIVGGCLLQGSPNDFEVTTDAPLSLTASIVGQSCIEPNEDVLDFSVTVTFVQGALGATPTRVDGTGCCKRLN